MTSNRPLRHVLLVGIASAALAACGQGSGGKADGKAEGQILERSVTDDMIPYDTIRSRGPLADPSAAASAAGDADADEDVRLDEG